MTYEEFVIKTKTLEEFYSKDYNETQKKIMYDELKSYDAEKYEKAIKFMCKTNRYRPILNEILDAMKSANRNVDERQQIPCKYCGGTGYFMYKKIENGYPYEYACLCICQNAEGLEYDGSKIADKEHRSKFYIKSAREVFGDRIPTSKTNNNVSCEKDIKKLITNLADQMTF